MKNLGSAAKFLQRVAKYLQGVAKYPGGVAKYIQGVREVLILSSVVIKPQFPVRNSPHSVPDG